MAALDHALSYRRGTLTAEQVQELVRYLPHRARAEVTEFVLQYAPGTPDRPTLDGVGLNDPALLDLFDRELLAVQEDTGQLTVSGFRAGLSGLKKRVLAGQPLHAPGRAGPVLDS